MLARPGSHSTNANAAVNLARWGEKHHLDPRTPNSGAEPPTCRPDGADPHPMRAGETSPKDAGTDAHTAPAGLTR